MAAYSMSLPALEENLRQVEAELDDRDAGAAEVLLDRLAAWRDDDSTPRVLQADLDRTLGAIWFSSDGVHAQVLSLLNAFRATVEALGGMTMNERLHFFGLFDAWDRASNDERRRLRAKLEARR